MIGGGPAGAAIAARLGGRVTRSWFSSGCPPGAGGPAGVFASPAAADALRRLGLDSSTLAAVAQPIPAMRVETRGGAWFRLTYGADAGPLPADRRTAIGFDRSRLDPALLELARRAGADVRPGWSATSVDSSAGTIAPHRPDGSPAILRAGLIVGADGLHSLVARSAGVARSARLGPRLGLTWHQPDPRPDPARDARMHLLRDGYVGIAPVAGGRVNIGIVLGRSWQAGSPGGVVGRWPNRSWRPSLRRRTTRRTGEPASRRTPSSEPGRSAIA